MKTLQEIRTWFETEEGRSHPRKADIELELNLISIREKSKHNHEITLDTIFKWFISASDEKKELIKALVETNAKRHGVVFPGPTPEQMQMEAKAKERFKGHAVEVFHIGKEFFEYMLKMIQTGENTANDMGITTINCEHNQEVDKQIDLSIEYINKILLR